ncbi:16844_t:CDS:2 [Funneliformis geosporum]|uniref:16844_t:CDS:1 n=1 Tax=Funneliformis geosporum TaxID=1117311 RepID=A0A9W4WZZ9_9GLOM|nr:16844_t:CDS:2 [Funneliformis geosporum]
MDSIPASTSSKPNSPSHLSYVVALGRGLYPLTSTTWNTGLDLVTRNWLGGLVQHRGGYTVLLKCMKDIAGVSEMLMFVKDRELDKSVRDSTGSRPASLVENSSGTGSKRSSALGLFALTQQQNSPRTSIHANSDHDALMVDVKAGTLKRLVDVLINGVAAYSTRVYDDNGDPPLIIGKQGQLGINSEEYFATFFSTNRVSKETVESSNQIAVSPSLTRDDISSKTESVHYDWNMVASIQSKFLKSEEHGKIGHLSQLSKISVDYSQEPGIMLQLVEKLVDDLHPKFALLPCVSWLFERMMKICCNVPDYDKRRYVYNLTQIFVRLQHELMERSHERKPPVDVGLLMKTNSHIIASNVNATQRTAKFPKLVYKLVSEQQDKTKRDQYERDHLAKDIRDTQNKLQKKQNKLEKRFRTQQIPRGFQAIYNDIMNDWIRVINEAAIEGAEKRNTILNKEPIIERKGEDFPDEPKTALISLIDFYYLETLMPDDKIPVLVEKCIADIEKRDLTEDWY